MNRSHDEKWHKSCSALLMFKTIALTVLVHLEHLAKQRYYLAILMFIAFIYEYE